MLSCSAGAYTYENHPGGVEVARAAEAADGCDVVFSEEQTLPAPPSPTLPPGKESSARNSSNAQHMLAVLERPRGYPHTTESVLSTPCGATSERHSSPEAVRGAWAQAVAPNRHTPLPPRALSSHAHGTMNEHTWSATGAVVVTMTSDARRQSFGVVWSRIKGTTGGRVVGLLVVWVVVGWLSAAARGRVYNAFAAHAEVVAMRGGLGWGWAWLPSVDVRHRAWSRAWASALLV